MPFVDSYEHSLDDKGRVVLPAKFRRELGTKVYVLFQDDCLAIYGGREYDDMIKRLTKLIRKGKKPPDIRRATAANTSELDADASGRITIPSRLREMAGLTGDVVISGALDYVEIWDKERWENIQSHMVSTLSEEFQGGGDV